MKKRFIIYLLILGMFFLVSACAKKELNNYTHNDDKKGITLSQDMDIIYITIMQNFSSNDLFRELTTEEIKYLKKIFSNLTFVEDPDYKQKTEKNSRYTLNIAFRIDEYNSKFFDVTLEGYVMVFVYNDDPTRDIVFTATTKIDYNIFNQFRI